MELDSHSMSFYAAHIHFSSPSKSHFSIPNEDDSRPRGTIDDLHAAEILSANFSLSRRKKIKIPNESLCNGISFLSLAISGLNGNSAIFLDQNGIWSFHNNWLLLATNFFNNSSICCVQQELSRHEKNHWLCTRKTLLFNNIYRNHI